MSQTGPSNAPEPYVIKLRTGAVLKAWQILEVNLPEAVARCRAFLTNNPLDRLASRGKIKKLKGELQGKLQYDVNDNFRVRYWVDRNTRTVYIEYAGPHP
jgi:hypothetical protein